MWHAGVTSGPYAIHKVRRMPHQVLSHELDDDDFFAIAGVGADLAGALAGGALGLVGGPAGALGGATLGVAVQRGARAVMDQLRGREGERAAATLLLIAADAQQRHNRGELPREDGFFDSQDGMRADAEELLEGILRQAAETWEERKLPYLAHLYGAMAHDSTISPGTAVFLMRLADSLTYRQLIAIAARLDRDHVRDLAYGLLETQGSGDLGWMEESFSSQEQALVDASMIHTTHWGTQISPLGHRLAMAMRLDLIGDDEFEKWLREAGSEGIRRIVAR